MIYEVIVDISSSEVDKLFDYCSDKDIPLGSRVEVPFGKRRLEGFVIRNKNSSDFKTKEIIRVLDGGKALTDEMLSLAAHLNSRKNLRYIDVLRLCIPSRLRGGRVRVQQKTFLTLTEGADIARLSARAAAQRAVFMRLSAGGEYETVLNKEYGPQAVKALINKGLAAAEIIVHNRTPYKDIIAEERPVTLTAEQQNAVDTVLSGEGEFLIHGVTGSGKTEIYMRIIEAQLQNGRTAVMLVPEISLTPQMLGLFRARFGGKVAVLHSGLSDGERYDEWRRLLEGGASIALGARSAVFAPLQNVGAIIIDEEHDYSYISESNPRYFTSDIAKFRRQYNNAKLVYGSATPSIESYHKAKSGEYTLITIKNRTNEKALPLMQVVDMREEVLNGNMSIFSRALLSELHKVVESREQAMLFINRRGFASFVRCRSCGYIPMCTDCDVSLTLHRDENRLKCHYCGKQFNTIDECPVCGYKHLKEGRIGTERVADELNKIFPGVKVLRMDNDTVQRKDSYVDILSSFASGEGQLLVGTQMIVKGHDFKNVTLVGILDADLSLYFPDFRSNENTFQLITQAAGRAGRERKEGKVIMQTYNPKHYVFRFARNYDYCGFYEKESNVRKTTHFPPYSVIVRALVSSEDEQKAMQAARLGYNLLKRLKDADSRIFRVQAMRAPVKRIMNRHRFQVVVWMTGEDALPLIYDELKQLPSKGVSSFIELNPTQMM